MSGPHCRPSEVQCAHKRRKNLLEYGAETTSFRSRNRPVTVALPETPEPERLCAAAAQGRMTKGRLKAENGKQDGNEDRQIRVWMLHRLGASNFETYAMRVT